MRIEKVHIDTIKSGDTIVWRDGEHTTVCTKDISYGGFMGTSIFGDSYKSGYELVEKVIYPKWFKGKRIN